ncbi:MAG TPA: transglycosylase SLT domain-containing protein [Trichormus sp.]|jgi:hypothetical protein
MSEHLGGYNHHPHAFSVPLASTNGGFDGSISPFDRSLLHLQGGPQHTPHNQLVWQTEQQIERSLRHQIETQGRITNYNCAFAALERLRQNDGPQQLFRDLQAINNLLHAHKVLLPDLRIVQDDYVSNQGKSEHGYAVLQDEADLPVGNATTRATSHYTGGREPSPVRRAYHGVHYHGADGHEHYYDGWDQSSDVASHGEGDVNDRAGQLIPNDAHSALIAKALQLADVPVTAANIAAIDKIVRRESNWNPNITNHSDANARLGHPSTGLMQTIPSTFKAYALKGFDTNIHDPLSNLIAGIRYAEARYGKGDGAGAGIRLVASRNSGY